MPCLVLCYHHVAPDLTSLSVSPETFRDHLGVMRSEGYRLICHDEFTTLADSGFRNRERTALITFDDGYADNWANAFPILQEARAPCVMFAITSRIEEGPVREHFRPCGEQSIIRWSELAKWSASGLLSVQTHTHTHLDAAGFAGSQSELIQRLSEDIDASIEALQDRGHGAPSSLAWPWGYNTAAMRAVAKASGIKFQFNAVSGLNARWSSRSQLMRAIMDNTSADDFSRWLKRVSSPPVGTLYSLSRLGYNRLKTRLGRQSKSQ